MKIIILAAGMGSRLGPLSNNTPKPLLDMGNGKTLLETQLESIKESGVIDEIVIVIGYCADQIEAKMKSYKKSGMKIRTLYNPFYNVSNNLMSLWLTKNEMNDDFIITNGDNIFDKEVFYKLVKKGEGIFLTTSKKEGYYDDDMKVIINKDGEVEKVSKGIPNDMADFESVGLVLVSGNKSKEIFKNNLEELAREEEYINKFWLEVFNRMTEKGIKVVPFEIDGNKQWAEMDLHIDAANLIRIMNEIKNSKLK